MRTIFESVVRKENDHTNLLCNFMGRHPQAAASALSYLIDRSVSDAEATSFEFRTQCSFLGLNGREVPDLLVKGDDFRCLIEAKIDPGLQLTRAQLDGYKGCFESARERHLCFLVPDRWKHSKGVDQVRTSLKSAGIAVHLRHWRELVEGLTDTVESLGDAILIEAVSFWKWRFEVENMSLKEKEFLDAWSGEQYLAYRKLQKTIDQARDLFDAREDYETELETSYVDSYGFYLKRARKYLLWIGIWTPSQIPLSYGFHATKSIWRRPDPVPVSPISVLEHNLWPLGPETWDNPEKIYANVKSFIDSQNYD
jgi:hypothetical protein